MAASVLVIDDEPKIGRLLKRTLRSGALDVESCVDPEAGLQRLREQPFDIVITDLRMPGMDGLEVLRRARVIRPLCEVVLMTAHATVATAREALKQGAVDYITKPFSVDDEMKPLIANILQADLEPPGEGAPRSTDKRVAKPEPIISSGETMRAVVKRAEKIARADCAVLMLGESGSGKEIFSSLIHSLSPRRHQPMIRLNCAALPEALLESELFGHSKGAFTGATRDHVGVFEALRGGTILLDEVGEMPAAIQPKLLRVLENGEFYRVGEASSPRRSDVRVLAATNRDLTDAIERGTFREDLYYRLNVVSLEIPPLRDHLEDLPELVDRLVAKLGQGLRFSGSAMRAFKRYPWPGNVRELANAVEHAIVLGSPPELCVEDLPVAIQDHERSLTAPAPEALSSASTLEEIEKRCILQALERTANNQTQAAQLLGITSRTLGYRLQKYGLGQRGSPPAQFGQIGLPLD